MTSGDNALPFLVSLAVALLLPCAFFAFTARFQWIELGAGGKAAVILFAYLTLIMWTNMVSFLLLLDSDCPCSQARVKVQDSVVRSWHRPARVEQGTRAQVGPASRGPRERRLASSAKIFACPRGSRSFEMYVDPLLVQHDTN